MRLSKKEIEAHLSVADKALSWLTKAREQFKSYSTLHDYEQNMPELIRFFRRLRNTASQTGCDFFAGLPEEYVSPPEIGKDYWFMGELIRITSIKEPRKNMGTYFFYTKYNDLNKPQEYSHALRFAGLLLNGDTEPFEDLPESELVPVAFPEANYEDTIKFCDEIMEKIEQIRSTTFWLKQCATHLQTGVYEGVSDQMDDSNNHFEYAYRLQRFTDDLATIADQIIPGSFIGNEE